MSLRQVCLCTLSMALLGLPAAGDDGAVQGVGGTIKPMKEHPSIVLKSQVVKIELNKSFAKVHCTFILHNTGRATSVLMGFPEEGHGDIDPHYSPRGFLEFRSFVDGKLVRTRMFRHEVKDGDYSRWHVKTVAFGAGQMRVVHNFYRMELGSVSDGSRFFHYTLTTGASWKGRIGRADIIVRLVGMKGTGLNISPPGFHKNRDTISWHFKNIEPKEDIAIYFYPFYSEIYINGSKPFLGGAFIEHKGGAILANARWLADCLKGHIHRVHQLPEEDVERLIQVAWDNKTKSAKISKGEKSITLHIGSRTAIANGQPVSLPAAPELRKFYEPVLLVPLRPVVVALGGKVHYDPKTDKTFITMPK